MRHLAPVLLLLVTLTGCGSTDPKPVKPTAVALLDAETACERAAAARPDTTYPHPSTLEEEDQLNAYATRLHEWQDNGDEETVDLLGDYVLALDAAISTYSANDFVPPDEAGQLLAAFREMRASCQALGVKF